MAPITIRLGTSATWSIPETGEWLETNGTGSYASSTLTHSHTRKYHGLLVANLPPPRGRYVLLSKFEDSLVTEKGEYFLTGHQYPGCLFPPEGLALKEADFDLYPRFTYDTEGGRITKSPLLIYGENSLLLRYEIDSLPGKGYLRLKPFLAFRNYHQLARANSNINFDCQLIKNGFSIRPYADLPGLFITTNVKSDFSPRPLWYYNFEYERERERGYDFREDLFHPGIISVPVRQGSPIIVCASLDPPGKRLTYQWSKEENRRKRETSLDEELLKGFTHAEDRRNLKILLKAARQFLITTPDGRKAVIAGYPWFTDWGRDTLIALPGLAFCTGRLQEGMAILTELGKHERGGLLPNFFAEDGHDHPYNTVDSSLWFFWACQQALHHGITAEMLQETLWPAMKRIIKAFLAGTNFNIHVTADGLLYAGRPDTHLTWMDAVVEGKPVTPRFGYAVEICALWYNALCFARELSERLSDRELSLDDIINRAGKSFSEIFWLPEEGYLADSATPEDLDRSLRPNQLLAISLDYSPLVSGQQKKVVEAVTTHLLTPYGLRTLAPHDPKYRGLYQGTPSERDRAYHQGTIWPWLFGHYGEAFLKGACDQAQAKESLARLLRNFLRLHLPEAGIGTISEIFSGDAPHKPDGCIAQAWSVAEIIRLYFLIKS